MFTIGPRFYWSASDLAGFWADVFRMARRRVPLSAPDPTFVR